MKSAQGFTLIELLITITITTTLATFGFNAYSSAQRRQAIKSATTEITSILDSTHKLALVGTRPSDCLGPFQGYQLAFTADSNIITTTPLCETVDGATTTHTINNIAFSATQSFSYRPLVGGVDLGGATTLDLEYLDTNSQTHQIIIDKSGTYEYEGIIE
jgi:prepilin-type N-terminal cleavage/methylation domain-containing protein